LAGSRLASGRLDGSWCCGPSVTEKPCVDLAGSTDGRLFRVAHVIETLGVGGAEVLLTDIVARLDSSRFRSRVFALDAPDNLRGRLESRGVEVEILGIPPRRRPAASALALSRALRLFAPDVVHTHLYFANVLGRLASYWIGAPPVVTTLHNPDYTYEAKRTPLFWLRKLLDRTTGRRNAVLIAVSHAVAQDFRRHMGWRHITVVPNGVDVDRFAPGPRDDSIDLWPPGAPRLLSIGRLHAQKGHGVLLDALSELRAKGLSPPLLVAGTGPLLQDLESLCARYGLADRVRFIGVREDVVGFLRSTDVFVFPSLYEAVGVALLEAMACGCAVIASRTGGIAEVVEDGRSGLLVPPGDPQALASALARLAGDSRLREELGCQARRRAEKYGIERTVRALENTYMTLAGRRAR
jgi:glycosyltransferase involved in cell wall biosynthesis